MMSTFDKEVQDTGNTGFDLGDGFKLKWFGLNGFRVVSPDGKAPVGFRSAAAALGAFTHSETV